MDTKVYIGLLQLRNRVYLLIYLFYSRLSVIDKAYEAPITRKDTYIHGHYCLFHMNQLIQFIDRMDIVGIIQKYIPLLHI